MKRALLIAGLIAAVAAAYWWTGERAKAPLPIDTVAVTRDTLKSTVVAEALVRAKSYPVSSERPGRIVSVPVREGDRVAVGSVLAESDSTDVDLTIEQYRAALNTARLQESEARAAIIAARTSARAAQAKARAMVRVAEAAVRDTQRGTRTEVIARTEHELAQAKTLVAEAARQRDRAEKLFAEGVYSQAARDAARTNHEVALAQLEAVQDGLNLLKAGPLPEDADVARAQLVAAQADLRAALSLEQEIAVRERQLGTVSARIGEARLALVRAQSERAKLTVRSPVAGVVMRVAVEPGAWANPGVAVVTVSSREDLHVEAEVRSEDVHAVSAGQRVELLLPGDSSSSLVGIVERLSAEAEPKPDSVIRSRIVRCRIRVEGVTANLVPGQELDVRFSSKWIGVLCVPNGAISLEGAAPSAWRVRDDTVERVVVELGVTDGDRTEIVSGLNENDQVVAPIPDGLIEGRKVAPRAGR
ncbi:MAG: efflux RND transporter periplasmic adaptor subunit [Methanoregulaceae archaeon]|nr:efflux RND transporter periplasmic adaptor subunit [Methanoregulaceae archaeon]